MKLYREVKVNEALPKANTAVHVIYEDGRRSENPGGSFYNYDENRWEIEQLKECEVISWLEPIEITKEKPIAVRVESLKKIVLFLEGFKLGRDGNILPLGTYDLEQLHNAIMYFQGDSRYKLSE